MTAYSNIIAGGSLGVMATTHGLGTTERIRMISRTDSGVSPWDGIRHVINVPNGSSVWFRALVGQVTDVTAGTWDRFPVNATKTHRYDRADRNRGRP